MDDLEQLMERMNRLIDEIAPRLEELGRVREKIAELSDKDERVLRPVDQG